MYSHVIDSRDLRKTISLKGREIRICHCRNINVEHIVVDNMEAKNMNHDEGRCTSHAGCVK